MTDVSPSDAELIHEFRCGDRAALMRLWLRYDGFVYGLARSIVRRREPAEDIAQEVFLKVLDRLPQLRDPTKFAGWLRSMIYNECRSWKRRQVSSMPLGSLNEAQHPATAFDHALQQGERTRALRQAIDELAPEYRETLELHYYEEYSIAEIAAFLELPATTVKWRLYKARELLRRKPRLNALVGRREGR